MVNLALIFRLKQSRLGVKAIGLSNALIKWRASAPDAVYSDLANVIVKTRATKTDEKLEDISEENAV